MAQFADSLSPSEINLAKEYSESIVAKEAMIMRYLMDVRETYGELTQGNGASKDLFAGSIVDLIGTAAQDAELEQALFHPEKDNELA